MVRKLKVDVKTLLKIFELVEQGFSYEYVLESMNILMDPAKLSIKHEKYKLHGLDGILPKRKNEMYSQLFKKSIVEEYIYEGLSSRQLCIKYNIPSASTIDNWIKRYFKVKMDKKNYPLTEVYTMKHRKTTLEERIEIVKHYLENDLNYHQTAQQFNINYNQVYNWVKKYKEHGSDGLVDGRGKGKPSQILTDEEKKEQRIKILEERNKYLEMENKVLKKKKEIERELMNRRSNN